jgi:hypothetical protein
MLTVLLAAALTITAAGWRRERRRARTAEKMAVVIAESAMRDLRDGAR